MKTDRSLTRLLVMPILLGAATLVTWSPNSGGADSPARPAAPAFPSAGATNTVALDPSNPFFIQESVLTPEQRTRYRGALEANRARLQEIDAQLQIARHDLEDAVLAEHLDELQVRAKATAVAQLEGEKAVLRARALATIRPTLTLEQVALLRTRNTAIRPKATPEQMEARRKEVKTNLENRLAADHEARRQQLAAKLEVEIAELSKKQSGGTLTAEEKERLTRLEHMRDRIKSGAE
jgi:Spy/CpxP family protein refolding chaperone